MSNDTLFECIIPGRARILKNSKKLVRNKSTGRMFPISSDRYKQWEIYASMFIGKAKAGKPVIDFPINLCVKFYFNDHQHEPDLSNLYQGLEDVLQKMNVIKNDKLIYSHDGSKKLFDDTKERIEITITKAC